MANQIGDWARNNQGHIGFRGGDRRPRMALVRLPNGMWTTDQWCIMTGNVLKPSGSQWLLIQFGWSYPERAKRGTQVNGSLGWIFRFSYALPDVPANANDGNKPANNGQRSHPPEDEVLNTAAGAGPGGTEKNYTILANGVNCFIPQMESGAAFQKRTFYSITDNGGTATGSSRATVVASPNWVAKMSGGAPTWVQE